MWTQLSIEDWVRESLSKQFGDSEGAALFGAYAIARDYLIQQVLEEIKCSEPDLSDHGPRHIQNVMRNVEALIKRFRVTDQEMRQEIHPENSPLFPHEIFLLLVSVIFHDVGNVFKRKNHNNMILPILKSAYPDQAPHFAQVRSEVKKIAGAHTGLADGSADTLAKLGTGNFAGLPVRTRDLAAILRLADELAEGPQRTSEWRYRQLGYQEDSRIYHLYGKCCQPPTIDMANGRIALQYVVDISISDHAPAPSLVVDDKSIKEILEFIYKRIMKLDQERKYTKHYSRFLSGIRHTSVVFEFFRKGNIVPITLEPLILSDLVVPGERSREISELNEKYALDHLHDALLLLCAEE